MASDYSIVMTTTEDEQGAAALARAVVEARLAACAQILAIRSLYVWDGAVNDAAERLLLFKTRADLYQPLEEFIRARHPYEVPEILQVPVSAGFDPYLSWVERSTRDAAGPDALDSAAGQSPPPGDQVELVDGPAAG